MSGNVNNVAANGLPQDIYRQGADKRRNLSMDPRAEFHRLFLRNTTLGAAAAHYGLTPEEMGLALHYARLSKIMSEASRKRVTVKPPPIAALDPASRTPEPERVWCAQCERRVKPADAERCASQWCKARA